ncbi:MAG: hypothetical protein MUE79_00130 [Nitratireductor sp.]|nr:hypothetical protein [Nitratireductor sp.]
MPCRIIFSLVAILAAAFLPQPATAHMAATGWSYGWDCCSSKDCAQVHAYNVTEGAAGVTVRLQPQDHPMLLWPVAVVIPYGSKQLRYESRDGNYHVCHNRQYVRPDGSHAEGQVICVYLPPKSF